MSPFGRRRGSGSGGAGDPAPRRRTGPAGEEPWWDPADQAGVETPLIGLRALGRGWRDTRMLNNAERLDPFGDDEASARIHAARDARVRTALDEGQAWRHHRSGSLLVLRAEVFADADPTAAVAHRAAWTADGASALDATWRQRWHERDHPPGWIEATWVADEQRADVGDDVDWIRIEDHTDPGRRQEVTVYEHLSLWLDRTLVTVTVRHPLGDDLDEVVHRAVTAVRRSLAGPAT